MTTPAAPFDGGRLADARRVAESVADPELPPLTIGELGIVREVRAGASGGVIVTVTPTYSGCPAAEYIEQRIAEVLDAEGFGPVEVERVFSPAWSTDWMTESGRRKLADAGIAPPIDLHAPGEVAVALPRRATPHTAAPRRSADAPTAATPPCPRCGSADTELISRFGSTACKALCRCRSCHEPVDYFKPI